MTTDYAFGVEKVAHTLDGEKTGWHAVRRTDMTGKIALLGMAKDNYSIVPNDELVNTAREAFTNLKADNYEEKLFCTLGGSRFYGEYTFRDKTIVVPKVGDTIGLRLTLNNSYDRSCKVGFSMGFVRLVCTNGMVTNSRDYDFNQLHSGKVPIADAQDAIEKAFDGFNADSMAIFGDMAHQEITQKQGEIIVDNMAIKTLVSAAARDSVKMIWADPTHQRADANRNLFNLYNAFTQHLTHSPTAGYDKFENSRKTSRKVFDRFERITRNEGEREEWTVRFPEKKKAVDVVVEA
jgi:hypothetical protein